MDIRQFVKWFSYIHHSYKPFNDYLRSSSALSYNLLRVLYHSEKGFKIPSIIFWKICFVYVGPWCQTGKKLAEIYFIQLLLLLLFLTHTLRSCHTHYFLCVFLSFSRFESEWERATLQDFRWVISLLWYVSLGVLLWCVFFCSAN